MSVKPTLNDDQKQAFNAIQKFLQHPAADTFVLKGYAGTGKTFLMQWLAGWLSENEHEFRMMASTGRAAAVLRGKTGFEAKTVHSELYHFSKVDGIDDVVSVDASTDAYGQMTMQFSLRSPDEEKIIYIVDEASMLSSELSTDISFASFGSGYLLTDLFHAAGNSKIIFVGDPCQLPPVKQQFSPALDMDWLAKQGRTAISFTLEKIERTDSGNDILSLAGSVRSMSMQTSWEKFPKLPAGNLNNISIHASPEELFREYFKTYKKLGTNRALAIARSNKTVQFLNTAFRNALYGEPDKLLQVGDILLVVHNNYKVPLANGDFVEVLSLAEVTQQSGLFFQHVKVKAALSGNEFELLLSLDILYEDAINFTTDQSKALMVDFNRRMTNKKITPNSERYKTAMKEDEYLNCLRCKFGYAVTCHKSQGGEWDHVFLFLEKSMYSMERPELCRWWYTAITRAKEKLHLNYDWWIV